MTCSTMYLIVYLICLSVHNLLEWCMNTPIVPLMSIV